LRIQEPESRIQNKIIYSKEIIREKEVGADLVSARKGGLF